MANKLGDWHNKELLSTESEAPLPSLKLSERQLQFMQEIRTHNSAFAALAVSYGLCDELPETADDWASLRQLAESIGVNMDGFVTVADLDAAYARMFDGADSIPSEFRLPCMSLAEAGVLVEASPRTGNRKAWREACGKAMGRAIGRGEYRAEQVSDRLWVFDARQFPAFIGQDRTAKPE